MNNLIQRSITGSIFIIVLISSIIIHPLTCLGLFSLITILGLWEFYKLAEKTGTKPQKITGTISGLLLTIFIGLYSFNYLSFKYINIALSLLFLPFFIELYRNKNNPFNNISYTILGIIYIAFPISLLVYFSSLSEIEWLGIYKPQVLLGYFFLLWTNDTGAYLAGKFLGKHKLFERISPKKTWEGAFGGGVLSLSVAYILSLNFQLYTSSQWLIIASIIVVLGNLGDLTESMFKRSINIKDSGTILPGHGGILDRFDGVFISAPFVFLYLQFAF